jgi:hypothetical protein
MVMLYLSRFDIRNPSIRAGSWSTSVPLLRRSVMRPVRRCLEMALSGWTATGATGTVGMSGFQVGGRDRHTQVDIGAIPTMTTISRVGGCMRAIGTMRTTATITMTARTDAIIITTATRLQFFESAKPNSYTRKVRYDDGPSLCEQLASEPLTLVLFEWR